MSSCSSMTSHRGHNKRLSTCRLYRVANAQHEFEEAAYSAAARSNRYLPAFWHLLRESGSKQALSCLGTDIRDVPRRELLFHARQCRYWPSRKRYARACSHWTFLKAGSWRNCHRSLSPFLQPYASVVLS